MRNMFTSSNNKNPLINCERKHLRHQNHQKLLGPKISLKCMKSEIKPKKKGYKGLTDTRRQKPWEKIEGKWQKFDVESGSVEEREGIAFWKLLK